MNQLQQTYKTTLRGDLQKSLGITNVMAVPRLMKVVVHCSMGEALSDKKAMEKMLAQLTVITGQKPMITRAKKAISTFKLRAGDAIGLKVTLRGERMYDFVTRLVSISLPRVRDFRGVSLSGLDGQGNYTMGITEQTIFPELEYSMIDKLRGFEVTFVTTAKNNEHAQALLKGLGIPFEKKE